MGRQYRIYLAGETVFVCRQCGNHLAVGEGVLSKAFHGQHGRAILVHHAVNVYCGESAERSMSTGQHTVRDVYCRVCHTVLGWKYEFAYEADQKYKEGRYILERELITERPEGKRDIHPRIEEVVVSPPPETNGTTTTTTANTTSTAPSRTGPGTTDRRRSSAFAARNG